LFDLILNQPWRRNSRIKTVPSEQQTSMPPNDPSTVLQVHESSAAPGKAGVMTAVEPVFSQEDRPIRYWRFADKQEPRDINRLRYFLGDGLEEIRAWDDLSESEAKALNGRRAAVASMKLNRVLNEAKSFYSATLAEPTDIYQMVGRPGDKKGRLVVVDLQGLSDTC
jgi:hypothetical protein